MRTQQLTLEPAPSAHIWEFPYLGPQRAAPWTASCAPPCSALRRGMPCQGHALPSHRATAQAAAAPLTPLPPPPATVLYCVLVCTFWVVLVAGRRLRRRQRPLLPARELRPLLVGSVMKVGAETGSGARADRCAWQTSSGNGTPHRTTLTHRTCATAEPRAAAHSGFRVPAVCQGCFAPRCNDAGWLAAWALRLA